MSELNPQVGKQLHALAVSPRLVTGVVLFRADAPRDSIEQIKACIRKFHETARGQQVLLLFKSDPVIDLPDAALESARQLLAEQRRLYPSEAQSFPATQSTIPPPPKL